jgi:hypothetical protein
MLSKERTTPEGKDMWLLETPQLGGAEKLKKTKAVKKRHQSMLLEGSGE